jgi:hypothetical protein
LSSAQIAFSVRLYEVARTKQQQDEVESLPRTKAEESDEDIGLVLSTQTLLGLVIPSRGTMTLSR